MTIKFIKLYILVLINVISVCAHSQELKDLFIASDKKITWLGIDFSHAKFIGEFAEMYGVGTNNGAQIRDKFFPEWNFFIVKEPRKYDIKGMLRKDFIIIDMNMINKLNSEIKPEDIASNNSPDFKKEDIQNFVNNYPIDKNNSGIGTLFIVEYFNKNIKEASIYFAVINIQTKDVLFQEKIISKPAGTGVRNYWGGAIFDAIEKIKNDRYYIWKKQFGK